MLTAGRCITGAHPNDITITHSSTVLDPEDTTTDIQVVELIIHEEFEQNESQRNDIGLIRLASPIQSGYVNFRAKLPMRGQYTATGTPAMVVGWGRDAVILIKY